MKVRDRKARCNKERVEAWCKGRTGGYVNRKMDLHCSQSSESDSIGFSPLFAARVSGGQRQCSTALWHWIECTVCEHLYNYSTYCLPQPFYTLCLRNHISSSFLAPSPLPTCENRWPWQLVRGDRSSTTRNVMVTTRRAAAAGASLEAFGRPDPLLRFQARH